MKKKDLEKRISELESERDRLKDNEEMWKDMIFRFGKELAKHGVEATLVAPDSQIIETVSEDGMTTKYIRGMTTEPPTIEFDFSKHDKEVMEKCE